LKLLHPQPCGAEVRHSAYKVVQVGLQVEDGNKNPVDIRDLSSLVCRSLSQNSRPGGLDLDSTNSFSNQAAEKVGRNVKMARMFNLLPHLSDLHPIHVVQFYKPYFLVQLNVS
jgi:hypothetical protein